MWKVEDGTEGRKKAEEGNEQRMRVVGREEV